MAVIRIPPALRATVGSRELSVEGGTVGEVLESMVELHPSVRSQLFDESGSLKRFVNVYLNQQDIQYLDGPSTPLNSGDTVIILPAMAGGTIDSSVS